MLDILVVPLYLESMARINFIDGVAPFAPRLTLLTEVIRMCW